MFKSLCLAALLSAALPLPALSQNSVMPASFEREIRQEFAKIRKLETTWPTVEKKYNGAVTRYKAATKLVRQCQSGPWSVLFNDTFKKLDDARKKLEEARKAINTANKSANSAMKSQSRSLLILEASYAGKARDAAYWEKTNTILDNMTTNYASVLTEVVVPGYDLYVEGMDELSESYSYSAEDCKRPLPWTPLRNIVKEVLNIVVGKISIANIAAEKILELVPEKFHSKS